MMVSALIISVLGNRILDGGENALVAAGIIPAFWIVFSTTAGKSIEFIFPLYAKFLKNKSPANSLILEDSLEVIFSFVTLILIALDPERQYVYFISYMFCLVFLYPITDISSEFYGAKLAQQNPDEALKFNANLYMYLSASGFLVAAPLGAMLSSKPLYIIMFINIILSSLSIFIRKYANDINYLGPVEEVDDSDYSLLGEKTSKKVFLNDLLTSGPASPLLNLILQVAGALCGQLFIIWTVQQAEIYEEYSMSITLFVFGLAATLGPYISGKISNKFSASKLFRVTSLLSAANTLIIIAVIIFLEKNYVYVICTCLIFSGTVISRLRNVSLETHRQVFYSGSQYTRIMSWSFAFGVFGSILGLQIAYYLDILSNPIPSLAFSLFLWFISAIFVNSKK